MFFQAESQLRQAETSFLAASLGQWEVCFPSLQAVAVFKCSGFVQGSHFQCIPSQNLRFHYDFPDGAGVKNLPAMQETWV